MTPCLTNSLNKRVGLIFLLLAIVFSGKSQFSEETTPSTEDCWGIQTGFLGVWAHYELSLSKSWVVRAETGLNGSFGTTYRNDLVVAGTPVFTLEPRWYFNLKKRSNKGKNISLNSADALAFKLSLMPNWFVLSNANVEVPNQITFSPTWLSRRVYWRRFAYELGIGPGVLWVVEELPPVEPGAYAYLNLHIRFGFTHE